MVIIIDYGDYDNNKTLYEWRLVLYRWQYCNFSFYLAFCKRLLRIKVELSLPVRLKWEIRTTFVVCVLINIPCFVSVNIKKNNDLHCVHADLWVNWTGFGLSDSTVFAEMFGSRQQTVLIWYSLYNKNIFVAKKKSVSLKF